jgi:hypothetical protein
LITLLLNSTRGLGSGQTNPLDVTFGAEAFGFAAQPSTATDIKTNKINQLR